MSIRDDLVRNRESDRVKPLVDYLKKNLDKGYKIQDLKWALVNQGHSKIEVDKATKIVSDYMEAQRNKPAPKPEPKVEVMEPEAQEKKGFFKKLFGR